MGVVDIILNRILAIELPDFIVRVLGVLDLVSLPVLVFSTVKKAESKK